MDTDSILFSTIRQKLKKKWDIFIDKYEFEGIIGEGGFGVVRKAHEKGNTNNVVAIKQFKFKKAIGREGVYITVIREICLLRELKHENVIEVFDTMIDPDLGKKKTSEEKSIKLLMVFPYCQMDVSDLLRWHRKQKRVTQLEYSVIRSISWQLFCGVDYLHKNWIMHRDIKPANLLVDTDGCVKIGDFGLARIFKQPIRNLSEDGPVITIWYRAPEILLGSLHYTTKVDVWSIGCVLYELFTKYPLFKGEEIKQTSQNSCPFQSIQLKEIYKILGRPNEKDWPQLTKMKFYRLTKHSPFDQDFSNILRKSLEKASNITEHAIDLISKCLIYDPNKRISCEEALKHPFFEQNREKGFTFSKKNIFKYAKNQSIRVIKKNEQPRAIPEQRDASLKRMRDRGFDDPPWRKRKK